MANFFDEIARNRLKSIILMCLFSLFFFAVIYLLVLVLGGGVFGLFFGGMLIIAYALFSYFYGSQMVLRLSRAKIADEKKYPQLYSIIEGLSSAAQLKMPKVYVIDTADPNAFATGRNRKNACVAVTTGLLNMMNKEELEGVLAHEISHIYNNDIQFMMLAIVFGGVIGIIAAVLRYSFFFGGIGNERGGGGGVLLIIELALAIIAPIIAMLIRLAISRRREYMADANGARMTRDPMSLAGALKKIKAFGQAPMKNRVQANATQQKPQAQPPVHRVDPITSSLYFTNPISMSAISNLFSTHPPIDERIKRLQNMH